MLQGRVKRRNITFEGKEPPRPPKRGTTPEIFEKIRCCVTWPKSENRKDTTFCMSNWACLNSASWMTYLLNADQNIEKPPVWGRITRQNVLGLVNRMVSLMLNDKIFTTNYYLNDGTVVIWISPSLEEVVIQLG